LQVNTLNLPDLVNYDQLLHHITEGLLEKKAKKIVIIDLRKLEYAPCDHFIICHGDSSTQVRALADAVEEKTAEAGELPGHREGFENAKWLLLDYGSVVVHIFQLEDREYYRLEELWGDADIRMIKED
jgi:ribosome-associated protein